MYLPLAEFMHNNWKNASTGQSPFYLLMGSHPRAEWSDTPSTLPWVVHRLEQLKEIRAQAQEAMTRAQLMWVKNTGTHPNIMRETSCGWKGTTFVSINPLPSWLPDTTVPFQ